MESETIINENTEEERECEDSTEVLLERYDSRKRRKPDDIPAMQTVVCILVSAVIFGLNAFYSEKGGEVFGILKRLAFSQHEVIPNPIDLIYNYFD